VYDFIAKSLSGTCVLKGVKRMVSAGWWGSLCFFQARVLFDQFLLAVTGKTDGQLDLVA